MESDLLEFHNGAIWTLVTSDRLYSQSAPNMHPPKCIAAHNILGLLDTLDRNDFLQHTHKLDAFPQAFAMKLYRWTKTTVTSIRSWSHPSCRNDDSLKVQRFHSALTSEHSTSHCWLPLLSSLPTKSPDPPTRRMIPDVLSIMETHHFPVRTTSLFLILTKGVSSTDDVYPILSLPCILTFSLLLSKSSL